MLLWLLCSAGDLRIDLQVITTPFHPGYITAERIAKAPHLKLALTAGIGSDHVDLMAASKAGITVAEITGTGCLSGGQKCTPFCGRPVIDCSVVRCLNGSNPSA